MGKNAFLADSTQPIGSTVCSKAPQPISSKIDAHNKLERSSDL